MRFNLRQRKIIDSNDKNILCLAAAASGKAIPTNTLLPTPDGKKIAKDIRVGDFLFDREGNPTKVLGVYPQGELDVYEITFGDERKAKCSKDHIWAVNKITWKDKNNFKEMTVEQLLKDKLINEYHGENFYIPVAKAVKYNKKNYLIHPYVIGTFIGDGCCTNEYLTLSSENEEIPNKIKDLLKADEIYKNPVNYNWTFKKEGHYIKTSILPIEIRELNCNKSIPSEYKYGSIEQRFELIRGLMDTNGSISKDQRDNYLATANITFTSTSYQLILDVQEILGSLGIISTITKDKRTDKYTKSICYGLSINMKNEDKEKIFWLSRKKEVALSVKYNRQKRKYDRTSIRKICNLGYKEEMVCFRVDNPEHLYLMNDYIPTHNTATTIERINRLIRESADPSKMVAFTFTNQAAEEMRKRLDNQNNKMFIGTLHSYANKICDLNGIYTEEYILNQDFDKIVRKALTVNTSSYPEVDYLFVDEFQDTDPLQYKFIEKIPAKNRFYCGDERQFIYGFRGCTDKFIRELYMDKKFKKLNLIENYRNPPNILKFANNFLNSMPKISLSPIAVKTKEGFIDEDCSFKDAIEEMTWENDWGNWAILCRTNSELEITYEYLNKLEIPNVIIKRGDLDLPQLSYLMETDRVKLMTIHAAKGLQFPNVIVIGAKTFNQEERRIAYVAATRAEEKLYWCPSNRNYKGKAKGKEHLAGNYFSKSENGMIQF